MYLLDQLNQVINGKLVNASSEKVEVTNITCDSRAVTEGSVFVAIDGVKSNAHNYVKQVYSLGAVACVVQDESYLQGQVAIVVENTRSAWSKLSAYWYNYPGRDMLVVGVTGTSGKTTILNLISQMFEFYGRECVRFGTLGNYIGNKKISDSLTTPDAYDMQKSLYQALSAGVRVCALEVSSHGLDQERVADLYFDVGIFSNLTRDHLDYHLTMEQYFAAKQKLFTLVSCSGKATRGAVINNDDLYGQQLIEYCRRLNLNIVSFGKSNNADLKLVSIELAASISKVTFEYKSESYFFKTKLIGEHNVHNLLAVFATFILLGYQPDQILSKFSKLQPIPGRLELVGTGSPAVYVDYSHKPDALRQILLTARSVCIGKLWVVFGCGGDRDRGKRPEMGSIASQLADYLVVTSDNPRTESPIAIINEIMQGVTANAHIEPDRAQAINFALNKAHHNDVIVIAGKGHEDYQIVGTQKLHFSDQEEVQKFFALDHAN